MDEYVATNRRNWDERAARHPDTDFYDVEGFLAGESSLYPLEREEFAPFVERESPTILHLQCHFGLDTLSLARAGANEVVGVDFSSVAIEQARDLAAEAGLGDTAAFVEADVLDLDLDRSFDVVYTSYGVLAWLSDPDAWAATVARHLREGGTFYIVENHPVAGVFENVGDDTAELAHPYFADEPMMFDAQGSYADLDAEFEHTEQYEFAHSLGEIVTALAERGLRIESLHEFPWATWRMYEGMSEDDEGRWWLPDDVSVELPLTFSLQATKRTTGRG
ncbi:class I SAM-dependent methyltransferase [Halococcus agarilyticus]|uniref:class I SAM-dependent methyltransferase n=1 Tax=Halococcus agarilyticus TaxID=1232219 RepID=UPI000677BA0D|nr:class I SAM-dependent methyltransferase [Halococcus agarilyticus]